MTQRRISKEAAEAAIQYRLAGLRRRSRAELESLPEWVSDETALNGQPVSITTYRENKADGTLQMVVQVTARPQPFLKVFSIGEVFVGGIAFAVDGTIHELQENDLYDYI